MTRHSTFQRFTQVMLLPVLFLVLAATAQAAGYQKQVYISNAAGSGVLKVDSNLVNPMGIIVEPYWTLRVGSYGGGMSTAYTGPINNTSVVSDMTIAVPWNKSIASKVTGVTHCDSDAANTFSVNGCNAEYFFATNNGTIAVYAPGSADCAVAPGSAEACQTAQARATTIINRSTGTTPASYKGVAILGMGTGLRLYATDFRNRRVDVFNSSFRSVNLGANAFKDTTIPSNYAPYGIQAINGNLYVTYARQNPSATSEPLYVANSGYVRVYDVNGNLLQRFNTTGSGQLNAPWGIALAPANFGPSSNTILISNTGDGTIKAYNLNGTYQGTLQTTTGQPLVVHGLRGIAFGNGVNSLPTASLFYTANASVSSPQHYVGYITYR